VQLVSCPRRLAASPQEWPWSSARAHLAGRDDALVEVGPALERAPRFTDLLELSLDEQAALDGFETVSPNGRPLGAQDFIAMVETKLGRKVRPGERGRKPNPRESPRPSRRSAKRGARSMSGCCT